MHRDRQGGAQQISEGRPLRHRLPLGEQPRARPSPRAAELVKRALGRHDERRVVARGDELGREGRLAVVISRVRQPFLLPLARAAGATQPMARRRVCERWCGLGGARVVKRHHTADQRASIIARNGSGRSGSCRRRGRRADRHAVRGQRDRDVVNQAHLARQVRPAGASRALKHPRACAILNASSTRRRGAAAFGGLHRRRVRPRGQFLAAPKLEACVSRLGRFDFGVNEARLESFAEGVRERVEGGGRRAECGVDFVHTICRIYSSRNRLRSARKRPIGGGSLRDSPRRARRVSAGSVRRAARRRLRAAS